MTGTLPRRALGGATRLNYVTKGSVSSSLQIRDTIFNADVSDFVHARVHTRTVLCITLTRNCEHSKFTIALNLSPDHSKRRGDVGGVQGVLQQGHRGEQALL